MLRWCHAFALLIAAASSALAQDFPNKPVRVIASSSAGGISDIFIRIVGEELHKKWGQPLVVENRPGGQFNIGAKACADAPPDGYTICILPSDVLQYNRFVFKSLNYDLFKDIEPVSVLFFLTQGLVVSSSLNVNTLEELAAYSKTHPKTLSYSAAAIPHQLFIEGFKEETGADIVRVPFRGGGEAVNGMLTGTTPVAFFGIGNFIAHLQAGTIRGLAVDAGKRSPLFPDIPTIPEATGKDFAARSYFGIVAPPGTPKPIAARLQAEIARISAQPDFLKKNFIERGLDPVTSTPDAFGQFIRQDRALAAQIVKEAGLEPQ